MDVLSRAGHSRTLALISSVSLHHPPTATQASLAKLGGAQKYVINSNISKADLQLAPLEKAKTKQQPSILKQTSFVSRRCF